MTHDPDEIHDPKLARELKAALASEPAPGEWMRAALAGPGAARAGEAARKVTPWRPAPADFLPGTLTAVFLIGLAVALWLKRGVVGPALRIPLLPPISLSPHDPMLGLIGSALVTLLFVLLAFEAGRGFPEVRRLMR